MTGFGGSPAGAVFTGTDEPESVRPDALRTAWPVHAAVRFLAALGLFSLGALIFRSLSDAAVPPVGVVAAWTVVVAISLWLARGRLDRWANRLTFGRQASGYEAVRSLLHRMSTSLPIDDVLPQLAESVGRGTQSSRTEVRLQLDDGQQTSQVWPPTAPGAGEPLTAQIRHLGDPVGTLELFTPGPDADRRQRFLDQVSGPAGVALSAVRLTWSLRRRAAELTEVNEQIRASQRRLMSARLDAQVRIQAEVERRVLVHLTAVERLLAGAGEDRADVAVGAAAAAAGELTEALDNLRSIARGIFPPRLVEAGLRVSLQAWADGLDIPVLVRLDDPADAVRGHRDIETCLYFVLVESGTWGMRSGCTSITIEIAGGPDEVRFRQVLTSIGTRPAFGELAAPDRVAAFGGTWRCAVDEAGLTVTGDVPLEVRAAPAPGQTVADGEPAPAAERIASMALAPSPHTTESG